MSSVGERDGGKKKSTLLSSISKEFTYVRNGTASGEKSFVLKEKDS